MQLAIIKTGGKQYVVSPGQKLKVDKINSEEGVSFGFDKVLLTAEGDNVQIGSPFVSGAKVEAKVLRQARDKKIIIAKYHNKTRYRKRRGHRQMFTEVEITKIS